MFILSHMNQHALSGKLHASELAWKPSPHKVRFMSKQEHEKYTLKTKTKRELTLPFSHSDIQKRQYHIREAIKRAIIVRRNL